MSDARAWIGNPSPDDKLDLEKIWGSLPAEAVILKDILGNSRIRTLLTIRSAASAAAADAQRKFKRWSRAAVIGAAVAALASALLLYGAGSTAGAAAAAAQPRAPDAPSAVASVRIERGLVDGVNANRTVIVVVQVIGLFMSTFAAAMLASLKLIDVWAENRNKAEVLRRELFNEVLKQAQELQPVVLDKPEPGNPIAQAMEFFRRYQHELQIAFYSKGASRHGRTAIRLTWLTAGLSGIAAVGGILGGLGAWALIISAFLGIAVPIALSAAQSWRAMGRDGDKAAAYQTAGVALLQIAGDVDTIRKKAALADAAAVRAYFDSVHVVMTTENSAWVPATK